MVSKVHRQIILASSSPRRKTLLAQLGLDFSVVVPEIDESWEAYLNQSSKFGEENGNAIPDGLSEGLAEGLTEDLSQAGSERPERLSRFACYAQRLAIEKARTGLAMLDADVRMKSQPIVIGADTCGEIDGKLLTKPLHYEDAKRMLETLSGETHQIHSAYALVTADNRLSRVVTSQVTMKPLTKEEIKRYWLTGEPLDKAGAYAIQGLGAQFIRQLVGSYSAVMGLPLFELAQDLQKLGIATLPIAPLPIVPLPPEA